jgi:photosystem II stability/assembly factor-like uncharacterized protein
MRRRSTLLLLLLAALPAAWAQQPGREAPDHAERREEARLAWYGGRPSVDYLDFKARAAAREVEAWRGLFRPGLPASAAAPVWRNLGPLHQTVLRIAPDTDGGRITALAPHPANPKVLYLATQSGLYRCANADPDLAGDWTWESLGDALPSSSADGNLSIGALALNPADPSTVYVGMGDPHGTDSRGFYTSRDGGATWNTGVKLGSATRTLDILALNAGIVLVGTNAGLWRSTDGGATFSNVTLGGSTGGAAWSLRAVTATDLVCTRNGLIFWSADQGASWTAATLDASVTALGPSRISVEVTPASPTRVWGVCNSGGNLARGLLKSDDKGHTWTFVAAPPQTGGLFQGSGWNGDPTNPGSPDMPFDGGQGTYNQGLAVDPTDPQKVFVGANLALYRTQNGGATWEQVTHWAGFTRVYSHADLHVTAWAKAGPKTLYLGSDGGLGILRQPDRNPLPSAPWDVRVPSDPSFLDHRRNKGLATQLIYHLGSTPAATPADARFRITAGLQDNGIVVRQDEGQGMAASGFFPEAVQANGDSLAGDGFGTVIHPLDGNLMLGVEQFNFTFRSSDGGATWALSQAGLPSPGNSSLWPFLSRLVLGLADPSGNTVYTPGRTGVWKSADFGLTWTAVPMNGYSNAHIIRNLAASRTEAGTLCVVTGIVPGYVTSNGGASWTVMGNLPNAGGALSSAWFDTSDANVLYLASSALNDTANHLWKSANRGASWTALDSPSNGFPFGIPVWVVQNAPWDRNELFAGTDLGLYRSTDGGATWARYGTGLPLVGVRDLYVDPARQFLRVATWGRGIWELSLAAAVLTVTPEAPEPDAGGTVQFTATLDGVPTTAVLWSVQEGPAGGAITAAGLYTAPQGAGTFHVVAAEAGKPTNVAVRAVTVWRSADADGNGRVDVLDLARLALAWGSASGQPAYDAAADLDGNGQVGDPDAARMLARIQ